MHVNAFIGYSGSLSLRLDVACVLSVVKNAHTDERSPFLQIKYEADRTTD